MNDEFATQQARRLSLLKYFPTNVEAIEALVELFGQWCKGTGAETPEQQCAALVGAALRKMREWQSPEALHDLFLDMYPAPRKYSSDGTDPNAYWVSPNRKEVA